MEGTGQNNEILDIEGIANFLKVEKTWIYERTRCPGPRSLPFFKVGKYLRFRLSDVEAWLKTQQRGWRE